MKLRELREMIKGKPGDAEVRIIVVDREPHTMYDVELQSFDPLAVTTGREFVETEGMGIANGEGFYELFSGDSKEILIEAELVGEASIDFSEVQREPKRPRNKKVQKLVNAAVAVLAVHGDNPRGKMGHALEELREAVDQV